MRSYVKALALALTAGLVTTTQLAAQDQDKVALEFRAGFPKPTGDFGNPPGIDAGGDWDFGADLIYNLSDRLSLYGGWGRDGFTCAACGDGGYVRSQGFEGGAKILFTREAEVLPWVRVGASFDKVKVAQGSFTATSDRAVGIQASAGMDIPLGETLSFSPAVRYQQYTADFPVLGGSLIAREDVSYVTLDFGLHVHIGS